MTVARDRFDEMVSRPRDRATLAKIARESLTERGDYALGLVPATFLPPPRAELWVLYWCAARRVDDSIESGAASSAEWRKRIVAPRPDVLADQCVEALLSAPELQSEPVASWLELSLQGMDVERDFTSPRPRTKYLELLRLRSSPTMLIFDALLAPDETASLRETHAHAFAASAQIGDDCRDVHEDLARGRCFVTVEEVAGQRDVRAAARAPGFAENRARDCLHFLEEAADASRRFVDRSAREGAAALEAFWRNAIESGEVRPTTDRLRTPMVGRRRTP